MQPRDRGLLCLLAALWGCSFMLMAISLESIPVFTTAFGRLALAGCLLAIYTYFMEDHATIDRHLLTQAAVLGLLRAALPITLILWAQTRIDSSVAGILNSTSALFTLLIAAAFTNNEKITRNKLAGVLLGMLGVALIMGTDAIKGLGSEVAGQLAMLGATLSYGFANVYSKRFSKRPPGLSSSSMLLAGALWLLPVVIAIDWPLHNLPTPKSTLALIALSVFSTACAFVVWFSLIRSAGAANTSLVTFLIPPIALLLGIIVLGESPNTNDVTGLAVIATGLWLSQRQVTPITEQDC